MYELGKDYKSSKERLSKGSKLKTLKSKKGEVKGKRNYSKASNEADNLMK